MPKKRRNIKFLICLTPQEKEQVRQMAAENSLTMAELFRAKTIKNRLPRRVTKVAGQTYWELGKIGNNLNQIAKAINTSVLMGEPVVVDRGLLEQVRNLVRQVRREIAEIDLVTEIQDEA
ncbi:MobC family plasmid mobilization relaxosome protein [Anabaena sp. UHCC 0187]|uniref:plasmid mobilization protein n=1 Tax=Anabaena sp. UHCC 0187 TaxID=2590018 RepID=UPI0014469279|nr:plasmid mobilization relaxosome protein MobC [Anabaena sp. UHCC 0187]MTJ14999.1 MobC family plasmid mobilization relaxosome protein [Anabaena sp. UHCC 0187]